MRSHLIYRFEQGRSRQHLSRRGDFLVSPEPMYWAGAGETANVLMRRDATLR